MHNVKATSWMRDFLREHDERVQCDSEGNCFCVCCQKNNATPLKVIWGFVGEEVMGAGLGSG